jgi:hypothetical protein
MCSPVRRICTVRSQRDGRSDGSLARKAGDLISFRFRKTASNPADLKRSRSPSEAAGGLTHKVSISNIVS